VISFVGGKFVVAAEGYKPVQDVLNLAFVLSATSAASSDVVSFFLNLHCD
jgi:hypothetical protein